MLLACTRLIELSKLCPSVLPFCASSEWRERKPRPDLMFTLFAIKKENGMRHIGQKYEFKIFVVTARFAVEVFADD
jgi:hypothetical protein